MKIRDSQRSKLYRAENILTQPRYDCTDMSVSAMEKYVLEVRTNPYLRRRYENELARSIYVGDGRARVKAAGDERGIYMPRWSREPYIVLHELSHCIQWRRYGAWRTAGHGWQFCAIYLDLVRFMMGRDAYEALKLSFRANRVRWTPKKRVVMSEEAKEKLRARMAYARSCKEKK